LYPRRQAPFREAGELLVSTTDTTGIITHCNAAFVRVSGNARDKLIGQPHNMIWHPDMSTDAYRDLWQTLGAVHVFRLH
jgi:aerotaxis receptor